MTDLLDQNWMPEAKPRRSAAPADSKIIHVIPLPSEPRLLPERYEDLFNAAGWGDCWNQLPADLRQRAEDLNKMPLGITADNDLLLTPKGQELATYIIQRVDAPRSAIQVGDYAGNVPDVLRLLYPLSDLLHQLESPGPILSLVRSLVMAALTWLQMELQWALMQLNSGFEDYLTTRFDFCEDRVLIHVSEVSEGPKSDVVDDDILPIGFSDGRAFAYFYARGKFKKRLTVCILREALAGWQKQFAGSSARVLVPFYLFRALGYLPTYARGFRARFKTVHLHAEAVLTSQRLFKLHTHRTDTYLCIDRIRSTCDARKIRTKDGVDGLVDKWTAMGLIRQFEGARFRLARDQRVHPETITLKGLQLPILLPREGGQVQQAQRWLARRVTGS